MATAANIDFREERGDSWTQTLAFEDDNGDPVDLSGWTIFFTLKESRAVDDADAAISKDVTTHDDAGNGQTSISLSASETADLGGRYAYDISVEQVDGTVKTISEGSFTFLEDVSDRPNP
jgi:hypothetical protein